MVFQGKGREQIPQSIHEPARYGEHTWTKAWQCKTAPGRGHPKHEDGQAKSPGHLRMAPAGALDKRGLEETPGIYATQQQMDAGSDQSNEPFAHSRHLVYEH